MRAKSAYRRSEHDRYFTPFWVTGALLSALPAGFLPSPQIMPQPVAIADPFAGGGHILAALGMAQHRHLVGSDIAPLASSDLHCVAPVAVERRDFFQAPLADAARRNIGAIVTNPPYGPGGRLALAAVERALAMLAFRGGSLAMLLQVDFDSGATRTHLFRDCPNYLGKVALLNRIRWVNLPQLKDGPSQNHAWFLWSSTSESLPRGAAWRSKADGNAFFARHGYLFSDAAPTPNLDLGKLFVFGPSGGLSDEAAA
ncbi:hypothetical protein [Afifella aestuarii]|uniref:hypothetical protein n=1 Tax=Afifella aestuarii TaxID=1909496 RepID=UPI0013E2FE0F|nr:hypothetical protein [Afifella aestuarii]